ncbi:MAG: hypothetical protein AVDCRST_MAG68-3629 [uncultured Gemmatimonadetes bacterium]|uniref:Nucleotidyltransferase-like domain-containing protein n=1 Tax=uncultured Gemmatimonadota bacterium TaxID=203437 RepID=A0A6J4M763_9BACT|nr:MAG: hypothetical protein AVDCRST_MAG68-3629 [uncultured Gemmatimonadota bacterium]
MPVDDLASMGRLLDALQPWLDHLVVVGGWAHRLHRFHPWASPPAYLPLRTRDADIAFSSTAPLVGDIGEALKASGFKEELSGEHIPPIARYVLGREDEGFYAEFLAPLRGSGTRRHGAPDATLSKAGVTAQRLRHLDLLLAGPWTIGLDTALGLPLRERAEVRLPNPVSFIAQKLLIQRYRPVGKQAQDTLYIHDTLELFAREMEALRGIWQDELCPALPTRTVTSIERLSRERFGEVTDVIRMAARIPADRSIAPGRLQAACALGLEEIFGA